ncbi:C-type lectin domain family 2 member D2-like [Aquarana catesbeiana]|uniref:C-type lectin domain family 2 member D2-like n=1 Tax=Aquarana catesbeiana TaxID=8400 RepID=UPI003CCA2E4D
MEIMAAEEGIWQKLRSSTVPLLYAIIGAAILVTVIIILAALLAVRGIWQKLRSPRNPSLYVIIAAILVTVIIIILIIFIPSALRGAEKTPETKEAQCMDDWILYRGKCYYFSVQRDTWTDSQNFCKSHNSSLAIIDNEKELNFLNLIKYNNYWIGLSRTQDDSGWVWTDGTFYSETIFYIYRKPTIPGDTEHVYLNGEGFRSESGRYPKKWICRSFLGASSPAHRDNNNNIIIINSNNNNK